MNLKSLTLATALAVSFAPVFAQPAQDGVQVRWDSYAPDILETDSMVIKWHHEVLSAIRVIASPPTINARHMAIINTAMYDAWAAYDDKAVGTRLGGTLRRSKAERTLANKQKAVAYAAYLASIDQLPTQAYQFRNLMKHFGYDPDRISRDPATPEGIATLATEALLAYRHHDGANQLGDLNPKGLYTDYTGYKAFNTTDKIESPTHWVPLRSGNGIGGFNDIDERLKEIKAKPRHRVTAELGGYNIQRYVTPHWGNVRPFSIASGDQLRPRPPLQITEQDYKAAPGEDNEKYSDLTLGEEDFPRTFREQARQILKYSASLDDKQKAATEYWADGPLGESPPGHWTVLAQYVSRRDKHSLDDDVKMFLVLGNAMMDASIACWEAKRHYDYVRPVSVVRTMFAKEKVTAWVGPNRGTGVVEGAAWNPYQELFFVTPPFSEYTSGHSTFSYAAATALRSFKGNDRFGAYAVVKPGTSFIEAGMTPKAPVTLKWDTFTSAAREAAMSRRYGGLHFAQGDLEGRKVGTKVGELVWARSQELFNGTAKIADTPHKLVYAKLPLAPTPPMKLPPRPAAAAATPAATPAAAKVAGK
ncbi:MAG: hypothetical protein A3I66_04145 [Burkholderiales bacterium RIFCSPLOWO2_02_FULL_57_36]|nr:MAG: hypothetical protein A3I66_04145 [Burkholderiales bacterium RIFCSPLOWO2_02_FULL_57_36]